MATLPIPPDGITPPIEGQLPPPPPDPEELKKIIQQLVQDYEQDDRSAHEQISCECRRYELYWQNIQDIIWDSTNRDWVSASGVLQTARNLDVDPSILDKTIGIYRAYGEIVAAALSQTLPTVRFFPADAENGTDIITAKTSDSIADLIQRHNDAPLLFLRALYTKFNQHFVAAYHTVVTDEAYGTVERPQFDTQEQMLPTGDPSCPQCQGPPTPPGMPCPACGSMSGAEPTPMPEQVPFIKEVLSAPKGRIRIEVYGPRHVKIQPFIKDPSASPYVILETDLHENLIAELYEDYKLTGISDEADVRRIDRRPTVDVVDTRKIHTLKRCWLRPWALNSIRDEEKRQFLKTEYPKGLHVAIVDKQVLEMVAENVEEHWTFLGDPFAEYIHGDPRGKFLIPIQDMVNDSEMLALETILHNIPEMFADPGVLDFKQYNTKEARPGQVNQAKAPDGQSLAAGFYQPQGATLSREVDAFLQRLQELAQFVIGAPPSIWGGSQQSGGTLGEYQQSRAQAQQRLGVDWRMLNTWWKKIMEKSVKEFRDFMKQLAQRVNDPTYSEHFVTREGESFQNVWIRLEDMQGELGDAEAETSDQFPVYWEQQRGLLFQLLQQPASPIASALLGNPENVGSVRDIIGLQKLKVPGEADRDNQLAEIQQMLMQLTPIQPDQFLDDHNSHLQTCKTWASSPTGRDAKAQNPQGYQLVLQHAMMHYAMAMQMMQAETAAAAPPGKASEKNPAEAQGSAQPPNANEAMGKPPQQ